MIKIFISHKRQDGIASAEAILLYEILKKKPYYKVFMDVRESYIGEFPSVLSSKIKNSDIFILLLPPQEVLLNKEGWVYREIKTALNSHEYKSMPKKILPIAFGATYDIPNKDDLGEIKDLLNYNILFFDKNDPNAQSRLYKAIGFSWGFYLRRVIATLSVLLVLIFGLYSIIKPHVSTQTPEVVEYTAHLSKLNSLNSYVANASGPTNNFLKWYVEALDNKDIKVNQEFNQAYVKQGIIRLSVLSYLAFTSGDITAEQNANYVEKLIEECYNAIPKDKNSPFSFNGKNQGSRESIVKGIIDISMKTLEENPNMKSIPEKDRQLLAVAILSRVWIK